MSDAFKTYLVSYDFAGDQWAGTIKARDAVEARDRLEALRHGRIDGEMIATVPVEFGPLVKAAVWLQNWWRNA